MIIYEYRVWMTLPVFSPTISPHIPSICSFLLSRWRWDGITGSQDRSLWQVAMVQTQLCCNMPQMHLGGMGEVTASLENARRNEQGPVSLNCFMTAQTAASNKQRNLTNSVVESDTQRQPEMAVRKVSLTFVLILAQNLLRVGLTHYTPQCQQT